MIVARLSLDGVNICLFCICLVHVLTKSFLGFGKRQKKKKEKRKEAYLSNPPAQDVLEKLKKDSVQKQQK